MMKVLTLFLSLVLAHARETLPMAGNVSRVSDLIQKMASNLYLEEIKQSPDQNVVLSPLSIHLAMSMLLYGADGSSSKQLKQALGLEGLQKENHLKEVQIILEKYRSLDNDNITLNVANALFVSNEFEVRPEFEELVESQFQANISGLDFNDESFPKIINEWAAKKTNGLINKLVPEEGLDADVRMVLMNAVYFKARWLEQFDKEKTRKGIFKTSKGDVVTDFMFLSAKMEYSRSEELSAEIVALPYIDEDYKLLIVHPEESSSVEHLEMALFNNSKATPIRQHLTGMKKKNIDLLFPKFETGSELSLVKHFQQLGVHDIFQSAANFSGISEESIPIGNIVHKTKIEVSEEGSEAAAATAVYANKLFIPNKNLTIDSPFLFFIMDIQNGLPIFMGRIVNPWGKNEGEQHEEIVDKQSVEEMPKVNKTVEEEAEPGVNEEEGDEPYEKQYVLSGSGPVAAYQGHGLGLYTYDNDTGYYVQKGGDYYLKEDRSGWFTFPRISGCKHSDPYSCIAQYAASLKTKNLTGETWSFGKEKQWKEDDSIQFLPLNSSSCLMCNKVILSSKGSAVQTRPDYFGTFEKTSSFSAGRPVYKNHKGKFLMMKNEYTSFSVWDDMKRRVTAGKGQDEGTRSLRSGSGPTCVTDVDGGIPGRQTQGWQYRTKSGEWVLDTSISVKCDSP